MPPFNPSLSWELLDTVFYRSRTCYGSITWPAHDGDLTGFDLNNYNIAVGPFASLIAWYPKYFSNLSCSDNIVVCTGSGNRLFAINWNFTLNPIAKIGWSENGQLIVVLTSGLYRVYYNYQGDFDEYDLFRDILATSTDENVMIKHVVFTKVGFAIQTSNNIFAYIHNYTSLSPKSCFVYSRLATTDPIEPYHITAWTVTSPPDSAIKSLSLVNFVIFTTAGVAVIGQQTGTPKFEHPDLLSSVRLVAIAPNQNFVAIYSSDPATLYILNDEFNDLLLQHKVPNKPLDMSWCSNDVVALSFDDNVTIVGPTLETLQLFTNDIPYLHGELDGLYYLTNDQLNFFSRVSAITENTFKIGSTYPSAILLDSIEYIDKQSPKANDLLDMIKDQLVMAVDGCIRASSEEFDLYWQKNLLRASAFGKVELDLYDPTEYVQTCEYLRILNLVRSPEIGIYITYSQLMDFGIERLIDLLLLRQLHYLCLKICQFLNLPNYKILTDWASCKLKYSSHVKDDELLSLIVGKLKDRKIDWTHIAYVAYAEGRANLARNLLTHEPNTSKKVQFLIDINTNANGDEIQYALIKADEDGDTDSLVLILLELYGSLSSVEFFKAVDDKLNAIGILKSIVYQIDESPNGGMLKNFMYQDDDIMGMTVLEALYQNKMDPPDSKSLSQLQSLVSRSKYTQYLSSSLNSTANLYKTQKDLKQTFPEIHIGEPIMETLRKLIVVDLKHANAIARKFNVSNQQYVTCVLKTLCTENNKHAELYEFATSYGGGKMIKFESFFYELFKHGERRQAGMYLPLCKEMATKHKIKSYIQCGMWKEAVAEAGSKKEIEILKAMKNSRDGWEAKLASDEIEKLTGMRP